MATLTLDNGQEKRTLAVQGRLGIQDAAKLKEVLLEALAGTNHIVIDASQAESIDLACAQLVCAAHRAYARAGKVLEFAPAPSPGFLSALADMAIDPIGCSDDVRERCLWKKGA